MYTMRDINQLTALKIKEGRNARGMTCQAIAGDLGITISSYSSLENGKVQITLDRFLQLVKVLVTPLIALLPVHVEGSNFNISHGDYAVNTSTYNNYQNKDLLESTKSAMSLLQHVILDLQK